jgi:hypothetical protein
MCDTHKLYKAVRKPKVACPQCWADYNVKHGTSFSVASPTIVEIGDKKEDAKIESKPAVKNTYTVGG